MAKLSTGRKKPTKRRAHKRTGYRVHNAQRITIAERIDNLERRVSALEAGFGLINQKLDNIGAGIRAGHDCNYRIVGAINRINERLEVPQDDLATEAAERGRDWKPSEA